MNNEKVNSVLRKLREAECMSQAALEGDAAKPLDYTNTLILICTIAKIALHPLMQLDPTIDRALGSTARILARHAASMPEEERKIDEALIRKIMAEDDDAPAENN